MRRKMPINKLNRNLLDIVYNSKIYYIENERTQLHSKQASLGAQIDVSNESSHYQNGILETPLAEESSWNTLQEKTVDSNTTSTAANVAPQGQSHRRLILLLPIQFDKWVNRAQFIVCMLRESLWTAYQRVVHMFPRALSCYSRVTIVLI